MRSIIYIILAFSMINIVLSDTRCEEINTSKKKGLYKYN